MQTWQRILSEAAQSSSLHSALVSILQKENCVPAVLLPAGSRWPFCSREMNLWPTSCPVSSSFSVQLWPVSLLAACVQFAPWNSDLTCHSKCYWPGKKSNRLIFLHPKWKDDSSSSLVRAVTKTKQNKTSHSNARSESQKYTEVCLYTLFKKETYIKFTPVSLRVQCSNSFPYLLCKYGEINYNPKYLYRSILGNFI